MITRLNHLSVEALTTENCIGWVSHCGIYNHWFLYSVIKHSQLSGGFQRKHQLFNSRLGMKAASLRTRETMVSLLLTCVGYFDTPDK